MQSKREEERLLKKEAVIILSPMSDMVSHQFFCVLFGRNESPGPHLHKS